jgi:hypothetical protein
MCVRTLFQRAPRTDAGDPKQREQPVRLAARRAGLTAWRSPRTSMPVVGIIQDSPRHLGRHVTQLAGRDGGRVGRGHQVGGRSASGPSVGSPTAGAISAAGQCGPMVPLPQRCSTQDAVGPSAAFAASPPPVPDRAALSRSCHCRPEPAATRPPQETVVLRASARPQASWPGASLCQLSDLYTLSAVRRSRWLARHDDDVDPSRGRRCRGRREGEFCCRVRSALVESLCE